MLVYRSVDPIASKKISSESWMGPGVQPAVSPHSKINLQKPNNGPNRSRQQHRASLA